MNYNLDEEFRQTQDTTNPQFAFYGGQGELLKDRAKQVDHVTEVGVNIGASTRAFMAGRPKRMVGIDPKHYGKDTEHLQELAAHNNIEYEYIEKNSLDVDIEPTDLLLLDGNHSYDYVLQELETFASKVSTWIILHDTNKDGQSGPTGYGVKKAALAFLETNNEWELEVEDTRLAGLMILKRVK